MSDNRTYLLAALLLAILVAAPQPKFSNFAPSAADISRQVFSQPANNAAATIEKRVQDTLPTVVLPKPSVTAHVAAPTRIPDIPEITLDADAAFAVTQHDDILFSRNSDTPLSIASISKLMTALVALNKFELAAPVLINVEAIRTDGDSAKLIVGETLSLHDALLALLVPSSNDAAVAIAQAAGGIAPFVDEMNATAERMGLTSAHFGNPHGLTPSGNIASARDVARLLQEAMLDPTLAEILRQQHVRAMNTQGVLHEWDSTDALLGHLPGIIAGKTGYTTESKGTLAIAFAPKAASERRSAQPQDAIVIVVVLGSRDRFTDTEALARWVMGAYQWQ